MPHFLLLGAGFSRNWGGWLASEAHEYLLGYPEITGNRYLVNLLWRGQKAGGFENTLAEIQDAYRRDPSAHAENLRILQSAVTKMFGDMNSGFFSYSDFEFQNSRQRSIGRFLANFDAIFTLNQDLLLEHFYMERDTARTENPQRWSGSSLPGMQPIPHENPLPPFGTNSPNWARLKWTPMQETDFRVSAALQPYFKLHGSSNWQQGMNNTPLMIMGGNKSREIGTLPILSWYHNQFVECIGQTNARLMVIGYGFRDQHINQAITHAVDNHNTKLFVISPNGADLARSINPTSGASIRVSTELEEVFERGLIGASRRSLREIFGSDSIEHSKVIRFFER